MTANTVSRRASRPGMVIDVIRFRVRAAWVFEKFRDDFFGRATAVSTGASEGAMRLDDLRETKCEACKLSWCVFILGLMIRKNQPDLYGVDRKFQVMFHDNNR